MSPHCTHWRIEMLRGYEICCKCDASFEDDEEIYESECPAGIDKESIA